MKFNLLLQVIALVSAKVSNDLGNDITGQILKPVDGKSGEQAAVIFLIGETANKFQDIIGFSIPASQYFILLLFHFALDVVANRV